MADQWYVKSGLMTGRFTPSVSYGGGVGYPNIILEAQADYVCTTKSQLLAACTAATTSGDIIFVPNGNTIDLTGEDEVVISAGVTVASDRGYISHSGGVIKKTTYTANDWQGRMFDVGGVGVRFTGIILEGQMLASSAGYLINEGNYTTGVRNSDGYAGLVVDNCELRGWSYGAVVTTNCPTSGRPVVKYCWIHDNKARGEGYGMEVQGGDGLFEWNLCNFNRHSITGNGRANEKYECRYNKFLVLETQDPIGGFHVDVHENDEGDDPPENYSYSGDEYHIHHNWVLDYGGHNINQMGFVHIRADPITGAYINDNIIETDWGGTWVSESVGLDADNYEGFTSVIAQTNWLESEHLRVYCTDNTWRGTSYSNNTGILWKQTI